MRDVRVISEKLWLLVKNTRVGAVLYARLYSSRSLHHVHPSVGRMHCTRILALLLASSLLVACVDQDPFGFSRRPVAGDFELEQFESGTYYLLHRDSMLNGCGAIGGTVERIGWNERYIAAHRSGGCMDGAGWMIVDTDGYIAGPLDSAAYAHDPRFRNIVTMPPEQAWKRLPLSGWSRASPLIAVLVAVAGLLLWLRRRTAPGNPGAV
jgi:hypothetical protein